MNLEVKTYADGSVKWRCNVHEGIAILGSGKDLAEAMERYGNHVVSEHSKTKQYWACGFKRRDGSVFNVGVTSVGHTKREAAQKSVDEYNAEREQDSPYVVITKHMSDWEEA